MRIRAFFVASIGLLIGLLVLAIWRTPRVTSWKPEGESIRAGQSITMAFNTPVSIESARRRFSINPPVPGDLNSVDAELVFEPNGTLEYGENYTLTLDPGVRGLYNLISLRQYQQSYTVAEPELVYLRDVDGFTNLWKGERYDALVPVSGEQLGIWDYSVFPDGSGVLVSSIDDDGSDDLIAISLDGRRQELFACADSECRGGRWQPDGKLVAYERRQLDEGIDKTEVWLVDSSTGSTWPVHQSSNIEGMGLDTSRGRYPRWSSDGRYLAYYNLDHGAIVVLDWLDDQPWLIPANLDAMGEWSPSGYKLSYTELAIAGESGGDYATSEDEGVEAEELGFYAHVMVADLTRSSATDLSEGLEVDDGMPEWRPDGKLVATGRSSGGLRQIWMLPLDGQKHEALTDDPFSQHTSLSWSPDGQYLAFMRSGVSSENDMSGVWILDLETGESELAAEDGFVPGWLP